MYVTESMGTHHATRALISDAWENLLRFRIFEFTANMQKRSFKAILWSVTDVTNPQNVTVLFMMKSLDSLYSGIRASMRYVKVPGHLNGVWFPIRSFQGHLFSVTDVH